VLFERLIDVEHGVARLVEAGQQLVDDNQDLDAIGTPERRFYLLNVLIFAADCCMGYLWMKSPNFSTVAFSALSRGVPVKPI
jgi:hypothetical protein